MKRVLLVTLATACACASAPRAPSTRATAPPATSKSAAPAPPAPAGEDVAARIARVEHGLLRGARIKGIPGAALEERMRAHRVNGLSVAVIDGHRVVWSKAYGLADAEAKTPVTETTLFQAGSISKPVTATAILKRVEEGKLALDRPVDEQLTSWKLPENDLTRKTPVTLRMLLSHTAGLNVHGFPGYAVGDAVPTLTQVLDGAPPANTAPVRVERAPGTKFEYSGGGYTIAQLMLVDTDHRPFPAILHDAVLAPLGMDHSTYEQPLPPAELAQAAAGYDSTGKPIAGKRHTYPEMAAAGLWTTPTDLAKFAIEIALASKGKSSRVLSPAMAARMVTKVAEVQPGVDVGLGLFLQHRGAVTYFGHDGADEGFQAKLVIEPDRGCGVAMMANSDEGLPLMEEMLLAIAAEYGWEGYAPEIVPATLSPARLAELAGTYQAHADRAYRVTVENGHLVIRTAFADPGELVAVDESEFVRADDETRYVFQKGADGGLVLAMTPPPAPAPSKRVADTFTVPMDDLAAGRVDQAIQRYRAAFAKSPDANEWAEARFAGVGFQLLAEDRPKDAALVFSVSVALRPDSMPARDHLAEAYLRAGMRDEAIAAYREVIACAARDKKTGAGAKESMRQNAVAKLKELGAAP